MKKVEPDNRFSVAQVTALCGGELPQESGFWWERVEYFMLEDGAFEPYSDGNILPGPSIRFIVLDGELEHWIGLGLQLKQYMKQVTDARLKDLYDKLFGAGWAKPRTFPLSTRNADEELKFLMMEAVSIETIERREGRIPSVK